MHRYKLPAPRSRTFERPDQLSSNNSLLKPALKRNHGFRLTRRHSHAARSSLAVPDCHSPPTSGRSHRRLLLNNRAGRFTARRPIRNRLSPAPLSGGQTTAVEAAVQSDFRPLSDFRLLSLASHRRRPPLEQLGRWEQRSGTAAAGTRGQNPGPLAGFSASRAGGALGRLRAQCAVSATAHTGVQLFKLTTQIYAPLQRRRCLQPAVAAFVGSLSAVPLECKASAAHTAPSRRRRIQAGFVSHRKHHWMRRCGDGTRFGRAVAPIC